MAGHRIASKCVKLIVTVPFYPISCFTNALNVLHFYKLWWSQMIFRCFRILGSFTLSLIQICHILIISFHHKCIDLKFKTRKFLFTFCPEVRTRFFVGNVRALFGGIRFLNTLERVVKRLVLKLILLSFEHSRPKCSCQKPSSMEDFECAAKNSSEKTSTIACSMTSTGGHDGENPEYISVLSDTVETNVEDQISLTPCAVSTSGSIMNKQTTLCSDQVFRRTLPEHTFTTDFTAAEQQTISHSEPVVLRSKPNCSLKTCKMTANGQTISYSVTKNALLPYLPSFTTITKEQTISDSMQFLALRSVSECSSLSSAEMQISRSEPITAFSKYVPETCTYNFAIVAEEQQHSRSLLNHALQNSCATVANERTNPCSNEPHFHRSSPYLSSKTRQSLVTNIPPGKGNCRQQNGIICLPSVVERSSRSTILQPKSTASLTPITSCADSSGSVYSSERSATSRTFQPEAITSSSYAWLCRSGRDVLRRIAWRLYCRRTGCVFWINFFSGTVFVSSFPFRMFST